MKSATHFSFGLTAVKSRCTRSGTRTAAGSEWVVMRLRARLAPLSPLARINRATWSRPMSMPAFFAARVTLRRPYTE